MRILTSLLIRLREWLRPADADDAFAEELRFHLDRQTDANLQAGMPPDEARRAARLSLGSPDAIREEARDSRAGSWFHQGVSDFRYGCRLLRASPGFAATALLIVAVGIAAVTSMISIVYGVVFRPLPYREPDRLVAIWESLPRLGLGRANVNAADYQDWRRSSRSFQDIALVRSITNFNLTGDGEPERVLAARVSANLFDVLGVGPALGRTFVAHEDEDGRDGVVILSDGLWNRRFGRDPAIVGRSIQLNGVPHTVVGVMRSDFAYPSREFQLWTPLTVDPEVLARRVPGNDWLAVGRLAAGLSIEQAQREMDTIMAGLAETYPLNRELKPGVELVPLQDDAVRDVRAALYLLLAAAAALLLIACLNLSSLLGARAAARSGELALRLALGASKGRLAVQALAEAAPMLMAGGLLGIGGAHLVIAAFIPLAPAALPRVENIAISQPVLVLSIAALLLTGLIASLMPLAQTYRLNAAGLGWDGGRGAIGSRRHTRTRSALVVAQIALVVPLMIASGLLIRSFAILVRVDPGFRPDNVLTLHLAIPRSKYRTDAAVAAFAGRIEERVRQVAGVRSIGMVNRLPLAGIGQTGPLDFDMPSMPPAWERPMFDWRTATPGYFEAMGVPLIEGRGFTDHDTASSPVVGIVDERIARTLWPGQSAVGKRFRIPVPGQPWTEVIGVVGHVKHDGLDVDPRPQVYWNYLQRAQDRMVLVVRGVNDVRTLTRAVIAAIHAVDAEQPVFDVRTMEQVMDRSTADRWLALAIVTLFGTAALILACAGVYGVIAYGVTQQLREFAVRYALGATEAQVTRLVIGRGLALATCGGFIGILMAAVLARAMRNLLFGVNPADFPSFVTTIAILAAVTLLASYVPARRAASVSPASALR